MQDINYKLNALSEKLNDGQKVTIMIVGLGSVGSYLLDYLISLGDVQIEIVVAGRSYDKMLPDVNIIKTAAAIRRSLRSNVIIDGDCNLEDVNSVADVIRRYNPDFIINSSRVYSGLKYGSISWHNLRAYGIWTPLAIRYSRNIMLGYHQAQSKAIVINTSYSDAVIPWLKSAGVAYPDFGSGNLNHLVPRIKFAIAKLFNIDNLNEIDVTLATSHFHDVVISKEGQTDGVEVLLQVKHKGVILEFDRAEVFKQCTIAMPTDQKRNMMNASSNFSIIDSILKALRTHSKQIIHVPGALGQLGGYPVIIDGAAKTASFDETSFSLCQMQRANAESIALDGVKGVENGKLIYTDDLITKVKSVFNVDLPKTVDYADIDNVADFIINNIIRPNSKYNI